MQQTFRKFFNRKMSYSILSNATPIISTADKLLLENDSYLLLENNVDKMLLEDGWLVKEDFENGAPEGWTSNGTVSWNYNTSPAPLVGNYSLATQSPFADASYVWSPRVYYDEVWFFLKCYTPSGNNNPVFVLYSDNIQQAEFSLRSDRIQFSHGGVTAQYLGGVSGVPVVIWGRYKKANNGNNGEATVYININSSSEIRPAAQINMTNGVGGAVNKHALVSPNSSSAFIFDKLRISQTEIGNSPN